MDAVKLLQQLIQIPSVNPDNSPGTDLVGEQKIANFLEAWLKERGFTAWQEEVQPRRPNLIARSPGDNSRPRLLLCPHLDTVGVGGMTIDPFGGDIKDGKIWGRGSSDTKGPMIAMLAGLDANKDNLARLPIAVDFAAFMGEESAQHGSKHFAQKYAKDYHFAIAGEPTSLNMVYATKGSCWFKVAAHGKAAHSSQPHLGENAIMAMARSLDLMNRKLANRLATFTHPILGHSTINIGTISGGSRPNIVPDYCEAEIDIRLTPDLEANGGATALMEDFIKEMNLPLKILKAANNPPMECPQQHEIISKIQATNENSKLVGAPWFSDAAHLSSAGIPSICMGPGSIDQAHTKDEFICIDDLNEGVEFFTNFIKGLA